MTKKELLKILETVNDDSNIFVVSNEYDHENDVSWGPDFESDISKAEVVEGELFITIDCEMFCN